MTDLQRRYKRNENFVFRQIENETILVPIKDSVGDMGVIYNLNPVGSFIWQQLDGERSLQEITRMVTNEFEVSVRKAEQDLAEFVKRLEGVDAVIKMPEIKNA